MLEYTELCTGEDSECLLAWRTKYTILAPRDCEKYCPWFVCSLDDWQTLLEDVRFCTSLIWWTLAVQKPRLKEFSRQANTVRYFRWLDCPRSEWDEYWSIDYDFAGIDTAGEEAYLVEVSKAQLPLNGLSSCSLMTLSSPLSINNPDIRREMEQTWSNVIAPTMFQGARAICLGTRFHFDDIHAIRP